MTTTTTLSMMVGAASTAAATAVPAGVTPADVAEGFATLLARVGQGTPPPPEGGRNAPATDDAASDTTTAESSEPAKDTAADTAGDMAGDMAADTAGDAAVLAAATMASAAPKATTPDATNAGHTRVAPTEVRADDTAPSNGPDEPHVPVPTTRIELEAPDTDLATASRHPDVDVPETSMPDAPLATPDPVVTDVEAADVTMPGDAVPEPALEDVPPASEDLPAVPPRGRSAERAHGNGRGVDSPPRPEVVGDRGESTALGSRPALLDVGSRASEVASPVAIDRVLRAVEALENAPPPRRMTFDVDGVRVAVSLSGREVAVELGGDRRLPHDLVRALADRGFDLAGESGRHGAADDQRGPARRWREDPPGPAARPRQRPAPVADDLRL